MPERDRTRPRGTSRAFADIDVTLRGIARLERSLKGSPGKERRRRRRARIAGLVLAAVALCVLVPPFRYPVAGRVSSVYFPRQRPESLSPLDLEMHDGLDIAAPAGAPVVASAMGVVVATGSDAVSGNWVRVRHLLGISTFYGHLSEVLAGPGSLVLLRTLRPIGRVGSTGRATGPHVHFELALGRIAVPPRLLLVWHDLRRLAFGR